MDRRAIARFDRTALRSTDRRMQRSSDPTHGMTVMPLVSTLAASGLETILANLRLTPRRQQRDGNSGYLESRSKIIRVAQACKDRVFEQQVHDPIPRSFKLRSHHEGALSGLRGALPRAIRETSAILNGTFVNLKQITRFECDIL